MNKIFVTGIAGTGKTSLGKEFESRGYEVIGLDEYPSLCAWKNRTTGESAAGEYELDQGFIKKHAWICDKVLLNKLLNKVGKPVFVLGIADNQKDFLDDFDKIFLLARSPEVFIDRIMKRKDNYFRQREERTTRVAGIL